MFVPARRAHARRTSGQRQHGWFGVRHLPEPQVNCHHNYVALEEHFGKKVFVTRKGAINAFSAHEI